MRMVNEMCQNSREPSSRYNACLQCFERELHRLSCISDRACAPRTVLGGICGGYFFGHLRRDRWLRCSLAAAAVSPSVAQHDDTTGTRRDGGDAPRRDREGHPGARNGAMPRRRDDGGIYVRPRPRRNCSTVSACRNLAAQPCAEPFFLLPSCTGARARGSPRPLRVGRRH